LSVKTESLAPTLLGTALAYARRGWPVFPIKPSGKEPLTEHGFKDATTDQVVIRGWWKTWPSANIGIPTGLPETFDVADFDDAVGLPDYQRLCREQPGLPRVLTGGGGRHLLYATAGRSNSAGKPFHWRGVGGYIVAPGSMHASGRRYEWIVRPNGQLPSGPTPAPVNTAVSARSKLAELLTNPPKGRDSGRNDWLAKVAGHYAKMTPHRDGFEAMVDVAHGLVVALPDDEVAKLKESIWSTEQKQNDFEKRVEFELETQRVREEARRRLRSGGWSEPVRFDMTLAEKPEPEHLGVGGFLLADRLIWLFGEPETGKSLLAYEAGVRELRAGRSVVLFDAEAGESDIGSKLRALGARATELARVAIFDVSGVDFLSNPAWPLARCKEVGARLAVFDSAAPLLAGAGLNENQPAEVGPFIAAVWLPMARAGVCTVVIDHVTKGDPHSRYPIAAGSKLQRADLAYRASAPEPFARGQSGRLRLKCTKDRSGWIGPGTQFDVNVTAEEEGRLGLDATRMTSKEAAQVAERSETGIHGKSSALLLAALRDGPKTVEELQTALGLERTSVSRLLNEAKRAESVTDESPRRGNVKTWQLAP
jgi:hypothetical protein